MFNSIYFIFPQLSCTNGSQGEKPKLLEKRSEGNKAKQKLHTVNPFHLDVLFIGDLLLTFLFPFLATNWLKCIWEWDRVKSLLTDPNVFLLQIKNENTPSSYFQSKWTWQIIEKGNSEREMYYLLSEWWLSYQKSVSNAWGTKWQFWKITKFSTLSYSKSCFFQGIFGYFFYCTKNLKKSVLYYTSV